MDNKKGCVFCGKNPENPIMCLSCITKAEIHKGTEDSSPGYTSDHQLLPTLRAMNPNCVALVFEEEYEPRLNISRVRVIFNTGFEMTFITGADQLQRELARWDK